MQNRQPSKSSRRIHAAVLAVALGVAPLFSALAATADLKTPDAGAPDVRACPALAPLILNGQPLKLRPAADRKRLAILAIGSSSTEGAAASSPKFAYPAQLALDLHAEFKVEADVLNLGVGGETANRTLDRLKAALDNRPIDLVIWQVGTNDALTHRDEATFRSRVDEGIAAVGSKSAPLILIDPQLMVSRYRDPGYARYAQIIAEEGARYHIPVLSRFGMMASLAASNPVGWKSLLSGDGVHMNDLGYLCLARSLAQPIAEAAEAIGAPTH